MPDMLKVMDSGKCEYYTLLQLDDAAIERLHDKLKRAYAEEWREYIQCHEDPQYRY